MRIAILPSIRFALPLALIAVFFPGSLTAQSVQDVFPLAPADRATIGKKGVFRVGVRGTDFMKMRFRIELSRDDFDTIAHTFDQMKQPGGWAHATVDEEPGAMYRLSKPLEDGDYRWRVAAWNGVEWVPGRDVRSVRYDAVPPAEVENVRMHWNPSSKSIQLEWDPVSTDQQGRPERVSEYRVYRSSNMRAFFIIRIFYVGTTETTRFEDKDVGKDPSALLFYKIQAVDEVDNEADRRYY